ncbi:MAG: ATP-grasp domain-containing protein [Acidobacteriota bacterium]|nr:ATP-grasp domain-containing protein [Acidobacteriota bacterium]
MKIYVSGLYCGTNPQPGVGIARSVRQAYPEATIVGVEYSNRCSGIHWQDFDDIWLQRPWEELNLDAHAKAVRKVLDAGGLWISGIDLEIMWFGDIFPEGHPNLLTPPPSALKQVAKPEVSAHKGLPVRIPVYVSTELSDWDLHAFCRQNDWKVWLKGPYYDAVSTRNWSEFQDMRHRLSSAWSTQKLFLQSHVTGYEESVCFCAYRGELLGAVQMRKRDLTEMSKTWAGDVTEVPEEYTEALRKVVKDLNWTGGAELEMVRDPNGQLWLLEMNPRFPAWIHGGTIAGYNLPGKLIEGVTGFKPQEILEVTEEFTRVVLEVPVRGDFPLPPLLEPFAGGIGHSLKHPSGLLGFANRLHAAEANGNGNGNGNGNAEEELANVPASFIEDIKGVKFDDVQTPSFLFLEKTAAALFERAARLSKKSSTDDIQVTNAYSMKTNPDERLVRLAYDAGFLSEAISPLEVHTALQNGFKPEQIILNGPGKWWHREYLPKTAIHAVFCDSVADLKRVVAALETGELKSKIAGVRLRTPNIPSRFGIPIDTPEVFSTLIESIKLLPRACSFGVHFHMASSNVGVGQWWHLFESILKWCGSIEALSGRTIELLDVGGGWFPDDWHEDSDTHFEKAIEKVREYLPHVRQIVSEPGKALAQPSMALAMRILEIQDFPGAATDVVVDGSIAELPMYFFYPHRILHQNSETGAWKTLGRGRAYLLGRLCMEHDVVASNVGLPEDAKPGDLLVFCDAGAYDRSMSYVFGRG